MSTSLKNAQLVKKIPGVSETYIKKLKTSEILVKRILKENQFLN